MLNVRYILFFLLIPVYQQCMDQSAGENPRRLTRRDSFGNHELPVIVVSYTHPAPKTIEQEVDQLLTRIETFKQGCRLYRSQANENAFVALCILIGDFQNRYGRTLAGAHFSRSNAAEADYNSVILDSLRALAAKHEFPVDYIPSNLRSIKAMQSLDEHRPPAPPSSPADNHYFR